MIFSREKWEDEREGMEYLKTSAALSWETVKSPLRNAYDLFVFPLIGEAMSQQLIEIYNQTVREDFEKKLILLAQRANILLAFWYDYAELNVLIGDTGFKRQESESAKTPYKYQEKQLRDGWKTKGFNALDDLLSYLENHDDIYPEYKESDNYVSSKTSIVENTARVNEIYFINGSRLTYLRLKPHFKTVEDTIIAPRLGELYRNLKIELANETPGDKYTGLRDVLRPVIVCYAIHRLLLETGNLSDKGLFFSYLKGDDDESDNRPVATDRMVHQAKQAESDAVSYWKLAERYIKDSFGIESCSGGPVHRDNKNKKSFWA